MGAKLAMNLIKFLHILQWKEKLWYQSEILGSGCWAIIVPQLDKTPPHTCLLASTPTSLSPSLVNATTEGVVRDPSAFSMTFGLFPSMTATQELVVPRSIPITAPLTSELQQHTQNYVSTGQINCDCCALSYIKIIRHLPVQSTP